MDIKELEQIMVANGAVLRAIPEKVTELYELCHRDRMPDARVEYRDECKREMLVVERAPLHAGKFLLESRQGVGGVVRFNTTKFCDSIEQAVAPMTEGSEAQTAAILSGQKKEFFVETPAGKLHVYEKADSGDGPVVCIDFVSPEGGSPLSSVRWNSETKQMEAVVCADEYADEPTDVIAFKGLTE